MLYNLRITENKLRQEGFLRCQTPTSTVGLKDEEYRVKNGVCRIESEELEGVGLRANNEGCMFKREERRVGGEG
jgi:hypothetical protein